MNLLTKEQGRSYVSFVKRKICHQYGMFVNVLIIRDHLEFLKYSTKDTLGAVMYVDVDPIALGEKIVEDMKAKRKALGWE